VFSDVAVVESLHRYLYCMDIRESTVLMNTHCMLNKHIKWTLNEKNEFTEVIILCRGHEVLQWNAFGMSFCILRVKLVTGRPET